MSNEVQPPQKSDEVDLGQLFNLIGNTFNRFINFIVSIFKGIYNVFLALMVHFYKRRLWYALAIILGLALGYTWDKVEGKKYGATMFIETNFNSAHQVYENINQLHQLTKDEDSVQLGKLLDIDPSIASQIRGFYVDPVLDENKLAVMYSKFVLSLDSLSRANITYEKYIKSLSSENFPVHKIGITAVNKSIFRRIEKGFSKRIIENEYLENVVEVNSRNLELEDEALKIQIEKTDSLVNQYLKIRHNEAGKKGNSGTNLYMGDSQSNSLLVDESKLIEKRLALEEKRREINTKKSKQSKVINVLSSFPETGYDVEEWTDKKRYVLPLAFLILTLLVFTALGLGRFLEEESKK